MERIVSERLQQEAAPQHEIQDVWPSLDGSNGSAFYILSGHANMEPFRALILSHPTVYFNSYHAIVDPDEKLAAIRHRRRLPLSGRWVTLRGGHYHGDVGYVVRDGLWADVLVLPRISEHDDMFSDADPEHTNSYDHNRLARPEPSILDNAFLIGHCPGGTFDADLELVTYRANRLCRALSIHPRHRQLFLASVNRRINILTLPLPANWIFEEGDRVMDPITHEIGRIVGQNSDVFLVEGNNGTQMTIPLSQVVKFFDVGDYVEVVSPDSKVARGWVTRWDWSEAADGAQVNPDPTIARRRHHLRAMEVFCTFSAGSWIGREVSKFIQ